MSQKIFFCSESNRNGYVIHKATSVNYLPHILGNIFSFFFFARYSQFHIYEYICIFTIYMQCKQIDNLQFVWLFQNQITKRHQECCWLFLRIPTISLLFFYLLYHLWLILNVILTHISGTELFRNTEKQRGCCVLTVFAEKYLCLIFCKFCKYISQSKQIQFFN